MHRREEGRELGEDVVWDMAKGEVASELLARARPGDVVLVMGAGDIGEVARELARRLADTNATSNSLHPGVIPTNLSRHQPERKYDMSDPRFKTIPQGAATQCYLATSPGLAGVTGYYFDNSNPAVPSEHMQDDQMAARLWEVSEELVADYL